MEDRETLLLRRAPGGQKCLIQVGSSRKRILSGR